jgi:putative DNA primase/helicase
MSEDPKVVDLRRNRLPPPRTESARQLREWIESRLNQTQFDWELTLKEDANRFGLAEAELRRLINAVIKEHEQDQKEEQKRKREEEREEEEREAEREAEREEREEREERRERREVTEQRQAQREAAKRERKLQTITAMPADERDAALRSLALELGEDLDALRTEFETRVEEERERIRSGKVEPWPEPVETRALLESVSTQIQRFIIFHQPEAATVIALWTCFAWVHDVAEYSPILAIQAADSEAGKTNTCRAIALLTPRSHMIVNPTGPSFYRYIDRFNPTMVVDDADRLLARRDDLAEIINASWSRGACVDRTDPNTGRVVSYNIFCPKVLNGIDLMPHLRPATRTRCITIQMWRKLPHEQITDFREAADDEGFPTLRSKLSRWATDNMPTLKKAKPKLPKGYTNRLADNFTLLLAIAELAGGDWPKRARAAALKFAPSDDDASYGVRLLAIMRKLFAKHGRQLTSDQAVKLLAATEEPDWIDYRGQGRAITKHEVAALLRPFGIRPKHFRHRGQPTRGYEANQFKMAFTHYLPRRTR